MTLEEQMAELDRPPLPIIVEGTDAYFRDQEELIALRAANPEEKWVAYHGHRRVAIGKSQRFLFRNCVEQGIPEMEIVVLPIDRSIKPIMDVTI